MKTYLLALTVACAAFAAAAATTDDIVQMSHNGASEADMLKAVDSAPGAFTMNATEVLKLREAKVSDKVISAVLRHTGTAAPAQTPADNTPHVAPVAPVPPAAPPVVAQGDVRINSADDVIASAKNGMKDEDLIKAVDNSGAIYAMGTPEILKLRQGNVSEAVVAEMIRHQSHHTPYISLSTVPQNAPQTEPVPQQAAPMPQNPNPLTPVQGSFTNQSGPGKVTIDNLDGSDWSYYYEPAVQTLWLTQPNQNVRGKVSAHSSLTLSMNPGIYRIRVLNSRYDGMSVTVYPGERSTIGLSRSTLAGRDELQAIVFERGERKGSGTLTELSATPQQETVAAQNQVVVQQPTTTYYTEPTTTYYYGPTYYSSPGYYYGRPYYGGGYYGGGYYGGGYYGGGGVNLGINIGGGGHHHH